MYEGAYTGILRYMYLRQSNQKRADGSVLSHLQIAANVWDPVKKRSRVRIVYNCGRSDDPKSAERLRRLARSILKRCSPEELLANDPALRLVDTWPYGDVYVLEHLWRRVGLPDLIAEQVDTRHFEFSVERALFAMVANRCCAPSSKRYCHEQWLAEDVRIERCESLELHHLYRAMDFLEAHKEAIEEGLYFRIADLLNLDVELMFYDTTSLHFEVDEEDIGVGEDERVRGSQAAGAKTYRALRKRGKSKNGRGDVPQVVVGLAVTREGFPVRHWVFPGNTVDVTTVTKVKEELKGWRLNRCVFVGDAGMVSSDNLHALARGGGRYIVCMPVHRGGEVDTEVVSRPGRYREVAFRSRRWWSARASVAGATWCASIRARPIARAVTAPGCWPSSRRSWRACAPAPDTASGCASCAPAAGMGSICVSVPPGVSPSTGPRSRRPSASTASSSCTATTIRSVPRTWRWDTSSCNASSRRGASSRAGYGCARSITACPIASTPTSP